MSTVMSEGELEFTFPDGYDVYKLDKQGVPTPHGMCLVDFVAIGNGVTVLIEVKDTMATDVPAHQTEKFRDRIIDGSLINEDLVPKARDSYTYLHLMELDTQNVIYCVVLSYPLDLVSEKQALQRLVRRLSQEAEKPWERQYVQDAFITLPDGVSHILPFTCIRKPESNPH